MRTQSPRSSHDPTRRITAALAAVMLGIAVAATPGYAATWAGTLALVVLPGATIEPLVISAVV